MQDNINDNENSSGSGPQGTNPYENNGYPQGSAGNYGGAPYEDNNGGNYSGPNNGNAPYGDAPNDGAPYGGASNNGTYYGGAPNNGTPYGDTPNNGAPYEGTPYNGAPYNSNNNGNGPYGNGNYGDAPNNGMPYGGAPYGNAPYGGNPYNQQNMNGNNPYGGYYHPNNGPQYGNGGAWTGSSPLVTAIRQAGRSVPFLIGTIGYTVYLVLTFFSLFIPQYAYTFYGDVVGSMGISVGTFVGMIPVALFVIGMWMFYLSCSRDEVPSTAGITLSRGAIITMIVLMGILTGIFMFVALVFMSSSGYLQAYSHSHMPSGIFSLTMGVVVVIFMLLFVFCILGIIYYVKLLKTTKIIRNTISTGVYCGKLPMYPLVINFLLAALNLFSLFSTWGGASVLYKIITLLAGLGSVTSLIATTVSLIMLRTQLESMK